MGDTDSKALVTRSNPLTGEQVMMLRRQLAQAREGRDDARQARETGSGVFRLLDGVLQVEHDGEWLAEYGTGRSRHLGWQGGELRRRGGV